MNGNTQEYGHVLLTMGGSSDSIFDFELAEGAREAARQMRTGYDMAKHAVGSGAHAQSLAADFIHRFGVAGPLDEAITRFEAIRDAGIDFVRVVPGSRDMPSEVGSISMPALSKVAAAVATAAPA